ncbi:high choriolytic enzyme 1-like [Rhinoderma darwinii]|uniref:high choriolytic enzyme 1-like n=1 Tax=Rhinoderma darwinii TaxID=43563 RepID=UPI003F669FA2
MELRLVMLMCLAGQTLPKPMQGPDDQNYDDTDQGITIFEIIETANKDIPILLREADIAIDRYRNARKCSTCMWSKQKNGIVPVPIVISPDYTADEQSLIYSALKEFETMTCVQFVDRSSESDYLSIESVTGCWSYIGKISGKQTVSLSSPDCMVYGVIQHEAMHNLAFLHEHTRTDRDNYINILWQNMDQADWKNFNIMDGNTLNLPYDYTSVMHYHRYAFSLNDPLLPTIVPKPDPTVEIGQRTGLSSLDVKKINAFYSCKLCREKLVQLSGSFSGSSNSATDGAGNCLWLIQVPGSQVSLQIVYLSIFSTDYIKVYDGLTTSSPVLLARTSGLKLFITLVSSGRNMLVEFVSTSSSKLSIFKAIYTTDIRPSTNPIEIRYPLNILSVRNRTREIKQYLVVVKAGMQMDNSQCLVCFEAVVGSANIAEAYRLLEDVTAYRHPKNTSSA